MHPLRSIAPVKEHCTRSERVQCLLMGCTAPSVTSKNTELPEWRTPKDPQGLALVPGGGGRAWPGLETTRRAKLAARTASGRAAAPRHQHADKQENTSSADGKQAAHGADGKQAGLAGGSQRRRRAGSSRRGRRVGGPSGRAEWAGRAGGPSGRAERAGRAGGPSGRAERAGLAGGPSGRAERAGLAGGPSGRAERAGRRHQAPTRRTRAYNEAGTRRAKQRRGPRPRETVRPDGPP